MPPRGPLVKPRLLAYMRERHDHILYVEDLAQVMGVTEKTIQVCIGNIKRAEPDLPIMVEQAGRSWTYQSNMVRIIKRRFIEVGTSSNGTIVVEDEAETGKLYSLKELS